MDSERTCCVPTCKRPRSPGTPINGFPNPTTDPDRFRTWLYAIGGDILGLDNQYIYKYRNVCRHHFEPCYHFGNRRLTNHAIPTLNMPDCSSHLTSARKDMELSDSNQKPADVEKREEANIVFQVTDNVKIKIDNVNESMFLDGNLFKQEPVEPVLMETSENLYDSYFDVMKHELCVNDSEIEHLTDNNTDSTTTDISNMIKSKHIQSEPSHAGTYMPEDCAERLYPVIIKDVRMDDASSAIEDSFESQQSLNDAIGADTIYYERKKHKRTKSLCKLKDMSPDNNVPDDQKDRKPNNTTSETNEENSTDLPEQVSKTDNSLPVRQKKKITSPNKLTRQGRAKKAKCTNNKIDQLSLNNNTYECTKCEYVTIIKNSFIKHIYAKHNSKELHCCNICKCTFVLKSQLVKHMKTHTEGDIYSCEQCDFKSHNPSALRIHTRTHTGEKPYSCEHCNYKCAQICNLTVHTRLHTGEKPYSCKHCDFKCTSSSGLQRHTRIHNEERPYSCKNCGYKCWQLNNLNTHMKVHTGVLLHSCTQCDYVCLKKSRLTRHIWTHTGEKPYRCTHCDYKCSLKNSLRVHIRRHTGEKPYSCQQCDYNTSHIGDLQRHRRTHTGEKPYSCKYCDYKFSQISTLITHMRTHTSEKP